LEMAKKTEMLVRFMGAIIGWAGNCYNREMATEKPRQ
jgi:hypothetical protein